MTFAASLRRAFASTTTTRRMAGMASVASRDAPALEAIRVESDDARETPAARVRLTCGAREPQHVALSSLHARDWALLAHDGGYNKSFASVPAAFVRKPDALVARMGNFTAVVGARCCYFVEARAATARNAAEALVERVKEHRHRNHHTHPNGASGDFPMAALECALEESSRYYEAKLFRLRRLARHCVEEISRDLRGDDSRGFFMRGVMLNYSASQFQKLPPVRRAVVALEHDAREALDALNRAAAMETAPDESALPAPHGVALDDVAKQERSEALLDLLASHSRRMAAVGGLVEELTANLDAARELWELQLDGDRNRTEQMNFRATVVAMAAASAAVPASIGGMNMPHGFENAPTEMFWTVAGCIGFTAFASWYGFMRRFRMAGELTNARASELASMQYILSNMDTLDDAFGARAMRGEASSGIVTRDALQNAIRDAPGRAAAATPDVDEVYDLLTRVFDTNNSSKIELAEWRQRPS